MILRHLMLLLTLATAALFGQYKMETGGALPSDLNPAVAGVLDKQAIKISGPSGLMYEIWLRSSALPTTPAPEDSATMNVTHGALVGVIRFPTRGADRRGQTINPGVYTMRLSFFPQNGDHQGVAPQRDFLLLSPIAMDTDPAANPNFKTLTETSMKASGTPHPAVFSMWKVESDFKPGFAKMGESDWVLQTKVGGLQIAVILIGKAEG